MWSNETTLVFLILISCIRRIQSQDRLLIDVESDIPQDGNWELDCDNGYADLSTDFDCGPQDGGGGIYIPPEDLNGERGFWTGCESYVCRLKYNVQPGDTLFKARVYQRVAETQVSYDGIVWDYIPGKGWIEFEKTLGVDGKNQVSLRFSHFSPIMFNVLDKLVINGDFGPSPTGLPSTTESSTRTTSPECPTTPPPEPCNCCDRCPERTREIHHHYYPFRT